MGRHTRSLTITFVVFTIAAVAAPWWLSGPGSVKAQTGFVDLVLTSSDSPDPVASGDPLTYTVVVRNDGNMPAGSIATPVKIIDLLPSSFSPTSFSIDQGGVCQFLVPNEVRCQLDTLGLGDSATLVIEGYVTLPFGGHVSNPALVDLPVSQILESVEISNNIAFEDTTILAISTPSPTPTPTPTPTSTPTATATASPTSTPTSTPTPTPRPVGGVSYDIAGLSPEAASGHSPSLDGVPIAGVIGVVVGMLAASACVRYVKRRARA